MSLKLEAGAGLNSYGPSLAPQTCKDETSALPLKVHALIKPIFIRAIHWMQIIMQELT